MKRFIKVLFFLLFAINLQSAEMKPIFTNFINADELNVLIDQLVDIAGFQMDGAKIDKITVNFEKLYSADINKINELLTFLKKLEKEKLYELPAHDAKVIVEAGLSCMNLHQNAAKLSWSPKKTKTYTLDLSDPIRGSIKFLELLLQKIDSGAELSLIRQIILKLISNTLTQKYLKDTTFELAHSAHVSSEDLINLGLIYQALFVKNN